MSRIIGLGLSLLKSNDLEDNSSSGNFIIKYFSFDKFIEEENNDIEDKKDNENKTVNDLIDSLNELNQENTKIKAGLKPKSEDKKKELPPLPNIKIKDKAEPKAKSEDKKKELPPLPNIKKKGDTQMNKKDLPENEEKLNKNSTKKESKSFKIDKTFLKDD